MKYGWIVVAYLAIGCNQNSTGVSLAEDTGNKPQQEQQTATKPKEEASQTTKPSDPVADAAKPAPGPVSNPDQITKDREKVAGSYKLTLSAEQKAKIDKALQEIRAKAAQGDQSAKDYLPMAEQAVQAAGTMLVSLRKDGTYAAQLGPNSSTGVFTVAGNAVSLTPNEKPAEGTEMPAGLVLAFDPAKKTLTASVNGEQTVFKKTD